MSNFSFLALRAMLLALCVVVATSLASQPAFAQSTGAGGSLTTTAPLSSNNGDFTKGSTDAISQMQGLLGNIIPAAVTASAGVLTEANKFAWGLGVISLVLVGIRFSGTHHPISAWVNLFEELAILGIFVALYLGYNTSAPGFWNWFQTLATDIGGGANNSISTQMSTLAGTVLDALKAKMTVITVLTQFNATLTDVIVLLLAFVVMCLASVVFMYYSAVGQIQAAVGIVLGPIAIALGLSSYTRGYFQKWLDWMIHSGMYVVMVAVLMKLMGTNISSAVTKVTTVGGSTQVSGAYVFDLAVFILLLSFEIPKLAGMFGSGAGASGTGALKLMKGFI
ncbi:type IV secretion system protein [Paraburkholderia sp. RL17-337-BIB-A]|uniref:type IV secretion system protein n=1 Tax=Paraburkholderia sp. RL17-337-BIB-A TaxID=3031636 RepID=UPI0038B76D49